MKIKKYSLLVSVIFLAFFLRLYKLDKIPSSLYWDEAAIALDAKSVAQTGSDQHGNPWLQAIYPSWGDYKLPAYILVATPFFKVIKNNPELAVRLPSALAGILTVLMLYFLTIELFNKFAIRKLDNWIIGLTASFLLAISPWHLQFSRAAFEANLALLSNLAAIFCFLKTQKKWPWLIPTVIFSICAIYTYYSARIFLPAVLFLCWIFYSNKRTIDLLKLSIIFVFLWIFTLPLRNSPIAHQAELFRLSTKNVLSNPEIINYSSMLIEEDGRGLIARKIHHRFIYIFKELASHYFDHLSFGFFVLNGDSNLRHSTGRIGVLLICAFFGLIYGEYLLFNKNKQVFCFLNFVLIFAFLPACIPYETPHALRSLNAVVFINIIAAVGLVQVIKLLKEKYKNSLLIAFYFLLAVQFIFYLYDYYIFYPIRSAFSWQSGYKEAVEDVDKEYERADKIIFTDKYARQYIYFLLYSSYPLEKYQQQRKDFLASDPLNYSETFIIDKIEFRNVNFNSDSQIRNVLLVDSIDKPPFFKTWKNY